MVKEFSIQLNQSSFVAGSTVRGTVLIDITEPKNYKKIAVYLKGRGEVKWTETHSSTGPNGHSSTTTHTRHKEETYTYQEFVVWQKTDSSGGALPAGRHLLPFRFTIPIDCPSSFHDRTGKIEYIISGKIVSNSIWKRDHTIRYLINVLGYVDAERGLAQEPALYVKEKQLGALFFRRGKIKYSVQLPRSLFCVREEIPAQVKVDNGSGRRLKIKLSLIERIDYAIPGFGKHRANVIMVQRSTSLQPHVTTHWESENFIVPNIRPAITGSTLIRSAYYLHVVIKIPWSFNSSMTIPVVIGNAREPGHDPRVTARAATLEHYPQSSNWAYNHSDNQNVNSLYSAPEEPPSYWESVYTS